MTNTDILLKPSENKGYASLGFGCMRFPSKTDEVAKMTDDYMEAGFNYFDTAYIYGGSEEMLKKTLTSRYRRDDYMLADKIPPWEVSNRNDCDKLFRTMLKRLGVQFIDFLLVHSLDDDNHEKALRADAYNWSMEQKRKGNVGHVGFSFHGSAELLKKLLDDYPEMEFVQLQLNYFDVLRGYGKEMLDIAISFDKPVIAMEPMRGGMLAGLPTAAETLMKNHSPDVSIASWANRYVASLHGVTCVLSGMSSSEQMQDNIRTFRSFSPIDKVELGIIEEALAEMGKFSTIPCTGCGYCLPDCPQTIEIAKCFALYNEVKRGGEKWNLRMIYDLIPNGRGAQDCTQCGICRSHCPQHIEIPSKIEAVATMFM